MYKETKGVRIMSDFTLNKKDSSSVVEGVSISKKETDVRNSIF